MQGGRVPHVRMGTELGNGSTRAQTEKSQLTPCLRPPLRGPEGSSLPSWYFRSHYWTDKCSSNSVREESGYDA